MSDTSVDFCTKCYWPEPKCLCVTRPEPPKMVEVKEQELATLRAKAEAYDKGHECFGVFDASPQLVTISAHPQYNLTRNITSPMATPAARSESAGWRQQVRNLLWPTNRKRDYEFAKRNHNPAIRAILNKNGVHRCSHHPVEQPNEKGE